MSKKSKSLHTIMIKKVSQSSPMTYVVMYVSAETHLVLGMFLGMFGALDVDGCVEALGSVGSRLHDLHRLSMLLSACHR